MADNHSTDSDRLGEALRKLYEGPAFLEAPPYIREWFRKMLEESDTGFSKGKVHVDVWKEWRREPNVWVAQVSGMNDPTSLDGKPRIFTTRAEAIVHAHWLIKNCQDKEVELSVGPEIAAELEMLKTFDLLKKKESGSHE